VFRVLAGFGLVVVVAMLGAVTVGGALLVRPVRFTRFLNDAFGVPAIRPGAVVAPMGARLIGLALIGCGCWIAVSAYRAA
jgi:hypothetical protein